MSSGQKRLCFLAAETDEATQACERLQARYASVDTPEQADIVIALGGDGFMLKVLREQHARHEADRRPVYGMNCGTVGFLMNRFLTSGLHQRLKAATALDLYPLEMQATHAGADEQAQKDIDIAFNEVSLFRQTRQTAKIDILVDGVERLSNLVCDGILAATPAGSTAYNLSAHGPIIPVGMPMIAVTPISPFRPRRWRGALLSAEACIEFRVRNPEKRPVSAVADNNEYRNVTKVEVRQAASHPVRMLYDPEHNLEERILREQFAVG